LTDRVQRAVDASDHAGVPKRMDAVCVDCGERSEGGCVMAWLTVEDGHSTPKADVSFLCSGCDAVTAKRVRVLERWPTVE
jgi:hypothetical protein